MEHQTTLQGIVFQLDVAIEHLETQKAGLVFIYDMSGSKYSNFDYELSKKILTLLKVNSPCRPACVGGGRVARNESDPRYWCE